jgi:hypothetical protein
MYVCQSLASTIRGWPAAAGAICASFTADPITTLVCSGVVGHYARDVRVADGAVTRGYEICSGVIDRYDYEVRNPTKTPVIANFMCWYLKNRWAGPASGGA